MRTREIAIRMAIGARPATILGMLLRQSMTIAIVGLIAGSAIALGASAIIQSEYHGIIGIDGTVFAGAAALFVTLMLAASLQPAIRAARLDPVETLRDG
jgi:ABC-type antimicrobial peptide transport system permease subunit